jgi:hypothetical protein
VIRNFPANGIARVYLRTAQAESAVVEIDPKAAEIEVLGIPDGGAKGYHPVDWTWRETPAVDWGLDFVAKRSDDVLIVSGTNEIRYIHHVYVLKNVRIRVPANVEVVLKARELSGQGEPGLSPP